MGASKNPMNGNLIALEGIVHSGAMILSDLQQMQATLIQFAPPPESVRNPETAIRAIDTQLSWAASSYQRAILDHNDTIRRHLLSVIRVAGIHKTELSFPDSSRGARGSAPSVEMKRATLEDLLNAAITEIRRTTLTQTNLYNRSVMYYARMWVTGASIPDFPYFDPTPEREPAEDLPNFPKG